jgi:hypothetical protein
MMSDEGKKPLNESATPKTPDGSGEFSALPKGGGQEAFEQKSMFPKGGSGKDEASVQPKTVTPETDTIIPPANRD